MPTLLVHTVAGYVWVGPFSAVPTTDCLSRVGIVRPELQAQRWTMRCRARSGGGFILAALGRVPAVGDTHESHGLRLTILEGTPTLVGRIAI